MIAQIKDAVKKVLKVLHIHISAPVKGVYRKDAADFFSDLDRSGIDYVILRWYDKLPLTEPGEDFDILVSNGDCRILSKKLKVGSVENRDFIKCDVYPVNNSKGFLAYYPPFLAERCLQNRIKDSNSIWILEPFTYFCALAYHAVFHKGYQSGLASRYGKHETGALEHDYPSILKNLADKAGISIADYSLEGLESFLRDNDWAPPLDIYFRRSQKNPWIYDRLSDIVPSEWYERRGTACFVIRELGDNEKWNKITENLLSDAGASIVCKVRLSDEEKKYFSRYTRGGDWGKGPCKAPAGLPSTVVIAKKEMEGRDSLPHGVVEYDWVKEIKETIRKEYNKSVFYSKNSNILHSTDNGVEASYYVSILDKATGRNYEELL